MGHDEKTGPTQCHDITVYPEIGLAAGACEGYGMLLDIRDPVNPKRLTAVADSNFSYWHSATFNNEGSKLHLMSVDPDELFETDRVDDAFAPRGSRMSSWSWESSRL